MTCLRVMFKRKQTARKRNYRNQNSDGEGASAQGSGLFCLGMGREGTNENSLVGVCVKEALRGPCGKD